jgi:hypothetical protein
MATMAMDGDETEPESGFGGYVARTAPIMNIIAAIHAAPPMSEYFRPTKSIPNIRKIPVVMTLTVP